MNGLTTVTDDAKTIISTCVTMVAGVTVTMFVIIVVQITTGPVSVNNAAQADTHTSTVSLQRSANQNCIGDQSFGDQK